MHADHLVVVVGAVETEGPDNNIDGGESYEVLYINYDDMCNVP